MPGLWLCKKLSRQSSHSLEMRRLSHWNGKRPAQDQSIGKEKTWANLKILKSIFPFIPCWLWAGEVEKAEEPEIKLQISIGSSKKQEFQKNIYFCFIDYAKDFDCVDHNKLWKIIQEMGLLDHHACLLRNLYADQEATVRTGHGTADWFQIRKGICQGYILLPCLFNLFADYNMRNARLVKHSWN